MMDAVWRPVTSNKDCVEINAHGNGYEEYSCSFGYPVFDFEKNFSPEMAFRWMNDNPMVPIYAVLLYGFLIRFGQTYFETRKPWNFRVPLAAWNLLLSTFSAIGFLRTVPALYRLLSSYTMQETFCYDPEHNFGCGSAGLWMLLFVWSKFPELFDTFFIVVHKKPLIFLHWYHHVTVLLYCWHSYVNKAPQGIIFSVMNYAVHAVMYGYYFLMAVKCKPKWFSAIYITVAQISQMIVGVAATLTGCYFLWFDKTFDTSKCRLSPENNVAALMMYGSYLFLFLEFFFKRYFGMNSMTGASAPKREKKE